MCKCLISKAIKSLIWWALLLCCGSAIAAPDTNQKSDEVHYQISFCQTTHPILTIDEAVECDFESPYHPLALGFKNSPRWIRIQIELSSQVNQSHAIQVRPYFLRSINFYSKSSNGWVVEKAGSLDDNPQKHSDIGGYFFITKANENNLNTYYIQVDAPGIFRIFVSATPWPNSIPQLSGHLIGIGTQIGILVTILVFSLVSLLLSPTAVMGAFNVYMANLIFCILSGSGILAIYVFKQMPALNELLFFIGLCLKLGLWVWLAQCFLQEYKTPSWYKKSCWGIYGLVTLSIVLGCTGNIDTSILIILVGYTATAAIQIIATIKTPSAGRILQSALISGFGVSITLIYLAVASAFFPIDRNSEIPLYITRLTDFINPLIMLSIIVLQNRLVRKELSRVKTALTTTELKSEFDRKLLKERQTLIDMLAHELKNPLASIGLAADTLSRSKNRSNEGDQRRLDNINQAILSMDTIIERCSLINVIDQKSIPINLSEINLHVFMINLIESGNFIKRIDVHISEKMALSTDPQLLKIIMTNLIENAIKYSASDTKIHISGELYENDGLTWTRVLVSNQIREDMAPNPSDLFKRFYRHSLAKEIRGSGLGLSICRELCIALGGQIYYRSNNSEATFIVELPKC